MRLFQPRRTLRLYYWAGKPNFGDLVTPDILRALFRYDAQWTPPERCQLLGAGSFLDWVPANKSCCVWGSGLIREDSGSMAHLPFRFTAVRGELTRARLHPRWRDIVLGDPGLLANLIYPRASTQTEKIGIVPHYADKGLPIVERLRADGRFSVIDAAETPAQVAAQISVCKLVLSSSLHGLIFADSFGVPNVHVELSQNVIGAGYKFRDYYSATGVAYRQADIARLWDNGYLNELSAAYLPVPQLVNIQQNLIRVFPFQ